MEVWQAGVPISGTLRVAGQSGVLQTELCVYEFRRVS